MSSSRIPGFYKLSLPERRRVLRQISDLQEADFEALDTGGLDSQTCNEMIENVIGRYALPFAVALNFRINDEDLLLPMVIEEPSVVAAASNAARMIRQGGGFFAEVTSPVMIGQVQILNLQDPDKAKAALLAHKAEILGLASQHSQSLVNRGGGPVGMEVRILSTPSDPDGGMLVVHLHIDVCDAMGANLVNTVAEGVADRLAEISGGVIGLRILSNLATHRTVTVTATIPDSVLADSVFPDSVLADSAKADNASTDSPSANRKGAEVRAAIVRASRFAELDPYRATTHNKGIMNGVDAVLMATANDWRSVEAGAHAYAAHGGGYKPLAVWTSGPKGLCGTMTLPMAVGTVGGALQVHPTAKLALRILGKSTAKHLAAASAAAGLACNLAALRALATEGIQRGHMALHSRIVKSANVKSANNGANHLSTSSSDTANTKT